MYATILHNLKDTLVLSFAVYWCIAVLNISPKCLLAENIRLMTACMVALGDEVYTI